MELLGGRPRPHAELRVERFAAQVVLAHGLAAQALAQIGVDQHPVGAFLGGRGGHGAQCHLGGRLGLAVGEVGFGEGESHPVAQRGQLLAPGLGPEGVTILGQQFAGERGECGGQRLGRTLGQGLFGQGLGLVGVDHHGLWIEPQQGALAGQIGRRGAGGQFRLDGAAGGVQGDPQTAECGLGVGVRPADLHGLLAVEAVAGGDGEEFHEGAGAGAGPLVGERGPAVPSHPEPTEKVQPQERGAGLCAMSCVLRVHEGATVTRLFAQTAGPRIGDPGARGRTRPVRRAWTPSSGRGR